MKHIYIHCPYLSDADYRLTLERLSPDSVKNLTIHTHLPRQTTARHIESLVEVQKAFRPERGIRFRNYAVFSQLPRFSKSLCRILRKYGFTLELQVQKNQVSQLVKIAKKLEKAGLAYKLWLEETQDQPGAYRLFADHGLHVCFTNPQYNAQSADWFDQWLYDPAAQGVNTFSDIINMLLLHAPSPNCRHASCFGSTFRVDQALDVYLCPFHTDDRTKLGSLKDCADLNALLSCETVAKLLPTAVQKRQRCSAHCPGFAYCQGGCLLETDSEADCACYCETVERIRQRLGEVYRDGKLKQVNNIVKNAILNAMAFGTAFFNRQD